MINPCNNTLCTCFSSNASTVVKEILIPDCEIFVTNECTINCCPIYNSHRRFPKINPYYRRVKRNTAFSPMSNLGHINTKQSDSLDNVQTNQNEHNVTIEPCTPYQEESIPLEIADGKLLQVKLNLIHVCPKRHLLVGVLLCINDTPHTLKIKKVCKKSPCRHSCKRHCCQCCKICTTACFDFLLENCSMESKITLKIITEYLC